MHLFTSLYFKEPKLYQNRYEEKFLINHSCESDIYLVQDVLSKKKFALKLMSTENFNRLADEELDNLFCSKSSYITNFITIFRQDSFSCLVMDYCEVESFFSLFFMK